MVRGEKGKMQKKILKERRNEGKACQKVRDKERNGRKMNVEKSKD